MEGQVVTTIGEDMEQPELLYTVPRKWAESTNIRHRCTLDSPGLLFGLCPGETSAHTHQETNIGMLTAAVFITTSIRK